jgi:hypothetical protein
MWMQSSWNANQDREWMATSASSKEMETLGPVMVQFIRNGNQPRSSYGPVQEKLETQVQLWSNSWKT